MGLADYPAGTRFGPRTCSSFELGWIVSGDVEWICDDEVYQMPQGSVCLCKPGVRDYFIWDPNKRTRHGYIHFFVDDPHQVLGPVQDWPVIFQCGREEFLIRLLNHVIHTGQNPDPISQSLAHQGLKHALLCFVYQRAEGIQADSGVEDHPIIAKSMEYLRDYWRQHGMSSPSVEQIANGIDISRGHLVRIFKQEIGMSPANCIRGLRLYHAAMMLSRSNISVQDIAEECGFENQFHFSRVFKQEYGIAPSAYRKEIQSGKQRAMIVRAKVRSLARYLNN